MSTHRGPFTDDGIVRTVDFSTCIFRNGTEARPGQTHKPTPLPRSRSIPRGRAGEKVEFGIPLSELQFKITPHGMGAIPTAP